MQSAKEIIVSAYNSLGRRLSEEAASYLSQPFSGSEAELEGGALLDGTQVLSRAVFEKAKNKELFGSLEDLDAEVDGQRFQNVYGTIQGCVLDLARSYWTLRVASDRSRAAGDCSGFAAAVAKCIEVYEEIVFVDLERTVHDPSLREDMVAKLIATYAPEWQVEFTTYMPRTDQERCHYAIMADVTLGMGSISYSMAASPKKCSACRVEFPMACIRREALERCPRCSRLNLPPMPRKWFEFWK